MLWEGIRFVRLRHIEAFHAVHNSGSISGAARLLNVTQPSVSKVLSHAEIQLGFKLFSRIKGKLIPTFEAHSLIEEARKAYAQIRVIKNKAENLKEHTRMAKSRRPLLVGRSQAAEGC